MPGTINTEGLNSRLDSLATGFLFPLTVDTFLQLPVHDLTNHRGGHQAEQLQHTEDGGVPTHCQGEIHKITVKNRDAFKEYSKQSC